MKDKEEIKREISNIKRLNLKKLQFSYVYKQVSNLMMRNYSNIEARYKNKFYYRARINEGGQHFDRVGDLWYPPKHKTKINRANTEGRPVFYCSDTLETAVLEVNLSKGDVVTIMQCAIKDWKVNINKLRIVVLGFPPNAKFGIKGSNKTEVWGERSKKVLQKYFSEKGLVDEKLEINELIDGFLNIEFRKVIDKKYNYKYKITASIAKMYLDNPAGSHINGICYPSIERRLTGINWAFTTQIVDALFVPTRFVKFKITDRYMRNGQRIYKTERILYSEEITQSYIIRWQQYSQ